MDFDTSPTRRLARLLHLSGRPDGRVPARTGNLSARLRAETGNTLLLAIIVLAALSVSSAGVISYATANEKASSRERQASRAFNIAEAGLHYAFASVAAADPNGSVAVGTSIPASGTTTASIDGGTVSYYARKTAAMTWIAYATGTSPYENVSRQLSAQVQAKIVSSPAWDWGFAIFPPSGCVTASGGSAITVSVYITADFCPSGGSSIQQPPGTSGTLNVFIGGKFKPSGGGTIGAPGAPVASVTVLGGCPNASGGSCSAANSGIYTNSLITSGTASLTKPTVDSNAVYAKGNWRSPICTSGSFVFDNDTTRNSSVAVKAIFSSPTFDCTVKDNTGTTTVGRLAWNATTKTMTINGIVFIDTVQLSETVDAQYNGSGTIYINGNIRFAGSITVCGPPSTVSGGVCSSLWDPTVGSLMLAALNSANAAKALDFSGGARIDASAYANGLASLSGGLGFTGSVVADTATISGGARTVGPYKQPDTAPGAVPGSWAPLAGTWRQLK